MNLYHMKRFIEKFGFAESDSLDYSTKMYLSSFMDKRVDLITFSDGEWKLELLKTPLVSDSFDLILSWNLPDRVLYFVKRTNMDFLADFNSRNFDNEEKEESEYTS